MHLETPPPPERGALLREFWPRLTAPVAAGSLPAATFPGWCQDTPVKKGSIPALPERSTVRSAGLQPALRVHTGQTAGKNHRIRPAEAVSRSQTGAPGKQAAPV